MSGENQKGFTIIETSMFLAISALLFVGLISGVSVTINRQRYTDSVQSTHSFLQKQFNETLNVINNRPNSNDCEVSNKIRGASDCVILGKLITFTPNSDKITVNTVIGNEPPDPGPAGSPITINDFKPTIQEDYNKENYNIPWAAKIVIQKRKNNTSPPYSHIDSVAIIRSPIDGVTSVYAFDNLAINSDDQITNLTSHIVTEKTPAIICVQSQDISIIGSSSRFAFNGAGSQDGVALKSDASDDPSECGEL